MYKLPPISLWQVCLQMDLDYPAMQKISLDAGISIETFENMLLEVPVTRVTAAKVLAALSQHSGYPLTPDTVRVALISDEENHEST